MKSRRRINASDWEVASLAHPLKAVSPRNSCVAIATGAPVPKGFDAVVQHEQTDNGADVVRFDVDEVPPKVRSIHLQKAQMPKQGMS